MAGEKTEEPTPKKLQDAKKKGQVSKSQDLNMSLLFLALTMTLLGFGPGMKATLMETMEGYFMQAMYLPDLTVDHALVMLRAGLKVMFQVIGPFLAVAFVMGAVVNFIQVGAMFTMDPLKANLSKLDPIKGFKQKFFSMQTYIELAKSLVKIAVVSVMVYVVLKDSVRDVALTLRHPLEMSSMLAGELMGNLAKKCAFLFIAIGAADVFLQKHQHIKKLKMSKDEVKREHKQSEGDPTYKGHRKQMHQEILAHSTVENVKTASVVIVNPTHIAVALRYKKGEGGAPQLAAKGEEHMAKQIIEVAKQYGIPIMRNVPLAHALNELEIGDEIPEGLYQAVAEVLNWVYSQSRK